VQIILADVNYKLYSWPFIFHSVMQQQIWGDVGEFIPASSAFRLRMQNLVMKGNSLFSLADCIRQWACLYESLYAVKGSVISRSWYYNCESKQLSHYAITSSVTRTHSTFGDRAFAAASPRLWISLLPYLRDADLSYSRFKQSLKTFLFG